MKRESRKKDVFSHDTPCKDHLGNKYPWLVIKFERRRINNMDDKKTNMTFEDAEKDFKWKVFDVFSEKLPGVYRDKDGLIVVPLAKRENHRQLNSDSNKNQE